MNEQIEASIQEPAIEIACVANLFTRMMHFRKAGDVEQGHTHCFDHLTLLARGSLKAVVDEEETIFTAPHMIYIAKDKFHVFTSLEDDTVAFCIHALRDGNGVEDIIDPANIPKGVSALSFAKSLIGYAA